MKRLFLIFTVIFLTACTSSKFVSSEKFSDDFTLSGAKISTYNMLDIRDDNFGNKLLDEMDKMLVDYFASQNVESEVYLFKKSKASLSFNDSSNGGLIPIKAFVSEHKSDEQSFGTTHQLLIIPSQMHLMEGSKRFDIPGYLLTLSLVKFCGKGYQRVRRYFGGV